MAAGRPKSFDETEVLEKAMQLFWLRGYERLGLAELLEHLGISRQSLYDTYGNKRSLFIRTLEHYRATQLAPALALLARDGSPLDNVKSVLAFFEELAADQRCRGCFIANSLIEVDSSDEELSHLLSSTLEILRQGLEETLLKARENGELPDGRSPLALSRALVNGMVGLAVTGRLPIARSAIAEIHSGMLHMLG